MREGLRVSGGSGTGPVRGGTRASCGAKGASQRAAAGARDDDRSPTGGTVHSMRSRAWCTTDSGVSPGRAVCSTRVELERHRGCTRGRSGDARASRPRLVQRRRSGELPARVAELGTLPCRSGCFDVHHKAAQATYCNSPRFARLESLSVAKSLDDRTRLQADG
jgi:hypothetical protein